MLNVNEIIKATNGKLLNKGPKSVIRSVSINSRTIASGGLFVAIEGHRFDGHKFINQAIKKGAVAVVVSKKIKIEGDISVILVKDTIKAFGAIASFYRAKFDIPVIAVTGSAGKTSTKEFISSVLNSKYRVLKNKKTENNQFGVSLTLLKLKKTHDIAVIELGTNRPGDIIYLSKILRPTIAVFTNIGESHLEELKSKNGVFLEKCKILNYLKDDGYVIINADDKYLEKIKFKKISQKVIAYSVQNKSKYQAKDVRKALNGQISFCVEGRKVSLSTISYHNIYNALAAICCGRLFKISYNNINSILKRQKNSSGRQTIEKIRKLYLIDDTYNSNPVSFKSAIDTISSFKATNNAKKILICADMLELGKKSRVLHEEMADIILKSSIDLVLTKGKFSKFIYNRVIKENTLIKAFHCDTFTDIYRKLKKFTSSSDVILVKGSRSMNMDKVILYIKNKLYV